MAKETKRKGRRTQRREGGSINENNELKKFYLQPLLFLTCAFLGAAWPLAVHPQLTAKVFLPELSKPHVPAVVGQRTTLEVSVKRCQENKKYVFFRDHLPKMWSGSLCFFPPILTIHRRPLREDGDSTFCHPLLLDHRRDLRAPAVRAHPQEVTRQVVTFRSVQYSP